jgi:UDPglucose 6-dehydrogenase
VEAVRVCVFGLGHLGTVTAACLAAERHDVVGIDPDAEVVAALQRVEPPMLEPGLRELLQAHRPSFTVDPEDALASADVLWLADDTPVDEDDAADVAWVMSRATRVLDGAPDGLLVVVSSQLPVGTVATLEGSYPRLTFTCVPENLRLGRAVEAFRQPSRVVVGVRGALDGRLLALLRPFEDKLVVVSIESAEMTKHALNAFLATSVAFANEIATVCEIVGADAREVERGLRTDPRVGDQAYVGAGPPFAGGTLARDLRYLASLSAGGGRDALLLEAVVRSNDAHALWARRHLERLQPGVVAVWGLSYKPGTDSIRRSASVELCSWLVDRGIQVRAHDPAARDLPIDLASRITRTQSSLDAVAGADALVIAVGWPEYKAVDAGSVVSAMRHAVILDPAGVAGDTLGSAADVEYRAVGVAS